MTGSHVAFGPHPKVPVKRKCFGITRIFQWDKIKLTNSCSCWLHPDWWDVKVKESLENTPVIRIIVYGVYLYSHCLVSTFASSLIQVPQQNYPTYILDILLLALLLYVLAIIATTLITQKYEIRFSCGRGCDWPSCWRHLARKRGLLKRKAWCLWCENSVFLIK